MPETAAPPEATTPSPPRAAAVSSAPATAAVGAKPPPPALSKLVEHLVGDGHVPADKLRHALRVHGKLGTPQPLVRTLQDLEMVTPEQIRAAVSAHREDFPLGRLLVELGHLKETELRGIVTKATAAGVKKRLLEMLLDSRVFNESRLAHLVAELYGFPEVEPHAHQIDPALAPRAALPVFGAHCFVPFAKVEGRVQVAFFDPFDVAAHEAARSALQAPIVPCVARKSLVVDALRGLGRGPAEKPAATGDEQATIALANKLLRDALQPGASDVHVEPLKSGHRVRYRIDGVMVDHSEVPREAGPALISRLKIMAGADIAEKRRHQGGRIEFHDPATGETVDVRASFYVTINGEKPVLRLLNRKSELLGIDDLGMGPRMLERLRYDALDLPTGVVIITGPTGSGKTTTLYSCVDHLNRPDTSVITVEDPVEYVLDGIAQCSINPKINLTFEETLRHIVRQDPDVIVLGEIRDKFSAETAIQAALTGHKVLTTFHTEDSIGGLLRLMNMDIEAFLISSTVVSVVAQRLVRRVCPDCAEPHTPTPLELQRLGWSVEDARGGSYRMGRGCAKCRFTGYRGRAAVFELLVLNEMVKDAILQRRSSYDIRRISIDTSGLVTLLEDGLAKAAAGVTSVAEVLRNLPRVLKPRPCTEIRRLLGTP